MIRSLFVVIFFLLSSFQDVQASPFQEWQHKSSKEYAKSLEEGAAKVVVGSNKENMLLLVKRAQQEKRWAAALEQMELLVGKNPSDMGLWLELALIAYHGGAEGSKGSSGFSEYSFYDRAQKAATYVYDHTSDKTQRALALLVYGAASRSSQTTESLLIELVKLVDIKKLRADNPAYADLMPFAYSEFNVDRDSNSPQVCFTFSHPLSEKFKPADYFEITPKIDGAFKIRNTKTCLTGIQFGENYKVTIKEGIPSLFEEKTTESSKLNFLVDDKSPRLNFPTTTYILQKNDDQLIPLTAVNVKRVELTIVRVNERSFLEAFGRRHRDSLDEEISSYDWNDVTNRYGEPLFNGTMEIGGASNATITKQISLSQLVKDLKPGAYGIFVKNAAKGDSYNTLSASQWVLITDIGLTVFKGTTGLDINARFLSTAKASDQVELKLMSYNNQILDTQKTNGEGFAHFDEALMQGKGGNRPAFIFAYGGAGNFAALKLSEPAFDFSDRGVEGRKVPSNFDAFLYTERGVYRPGETVRINGLLRNANAMEIASTPLTFQLVRPDEVVAQTQTLTGNAQGFYEWQLPLSPSSRTGQWSVQVFIDPKKDPIGHTKFSVEDFVPTRLLVTLKSPDPILKLGTPVTLDVVGRFLFGSAAEGLSGEGSLLIQRHPNFFPKFPGYQFGLLDDKFVSTRTELDLPTLDKDGKSKLTVITEPQIDSTVPLQATIQALVRDGGGRPQFGTLRLDVQTYPYMIGIKPDFKNGAIDFQDKTADVTIVTLNSQGEQVPASTLRYALYREEIFYNWSKSDRGGSWEYKPVREDKFLKEGELSTSKSEITKLSLPLEGWGYYRLEVKDPKTGAITSFRFTKGYLSSGSKIMTPDKLTLVQDKPAYAIGETVRLHIQAPFDGEGLLVVVNQGVLEKRNIKVSKAGTDVTLTDSEAWGTGAYVLVSAFRPLQKKDKDVLQNALTPKRAVGLSWVALSAEPRTLKITMTPPKEMKPRQKLNLPVQIQGDLKSQTFVTVAAVDEGILFLTDFHTPKPQDYFFGKRTLGVEMRDLYGKIIDPIPGEMGEIRVGGDEGVLGRNLAALSKRSFRIVSLFQGPVTLDAKGNATVPLEIPDFNGTLRLMLVAYNKSCVGSGDAQLLVRDPIVSEPVFPRFLSVGDTSQMSLSLFNTSDTKKDVKLTVKGEGALTLEPKTLSQTIEKDGSWHTKIPLKGTAIGDGIVTITMSGEGFEPIHRTFELSVRPSTPPKSVKTTLLLQPGESKVLDLKDREGLLPNTQTLDVTASNRIAWDLPTILSSLMAYPYGCVEQTVSRAYAIIYKKDHNILKGDETQEDLDKSLFKALSILAEKQDREGGFPLWSIFEASSDAWLTAYAYDFMTQAKASGIKVPENTYEMAGLWLRNFVKSQSSNSASRDLAAASYALSLLAGQGIIEDGAIRYFFDTYYEKLSHSLSRAQLAMALAKIGDLGRLKVAYKDFNALEDKDPWALPYGSPVRNKAALIKILIDTIKLVPTLTPLGDTVESQIKLLTQEIVGSHNLSTQEMAWLIRAAQALTSKDKGAPAKGDEKIQFAINDKGMQADKTVSETLKEDVVSKGVTVANKGTSSLWVNTVLQGFPKEAAKAIQNGVIVERKYYTLAGQEVNLATQKELTQGDQLIVVLKGELTQKTSPEVDHYMLVVDWLPAGFEIDSGRFAAPISSTEDEDKKDKSKYPLKFPLKFPWDDLSLTLTTEARDDRFVAALELSGEVKKFTLAYRVRATTPGTYTIPGLHVEDMFIPTIYADTAASVLGIKEK
jgi:uncharacterized protein YfaS (alpha-2-macroglobulin family)